MTKTKTKKKTLTGETFSQEFETVTTGETIKPVVEQTIFDEYRKFIDQANAGYIHNLQYSDAMKMLRYVEKIIGHNISFSMSCPACMIDLVKMFGRLENKK